MHLPHVKLDDLFFVRWCIHFNLSGTLSQSVTSWSREFCSFFDGTGTGKNWSRKKKYWYRSRKKLVLEKSTGTGPRKKCSWKKVPIQVPEKVGPEKSTGTGTGKKCSRYQRISGNFQLFYVNIVTIFWQVGKLL